MTDPARLTEPTAEITANFVANNRVATGEIAGVIESVYQALSGLGVVAAEEVPKYVGAVSVPKSLADPTKIISMIDGKAYSVLKRHLTTQGLTSTEYRARYNLPTDYPMTAPAYSEMRKAMAVKTGLGRKAKVIEAAPTSKGRRKLGIAVADSFVPETTPHSAAN